jgi:signal transduction histidine kinase
MLQTHNSKQPIMYEKIQALEAKLAISVAPQEKVDTLNALARELLRTSVVRAGEIASQAYHLSQQDTFQSQPYTLGMIYALSTLANVNELQNNLSEALKQAYEALALCDTLEDLHPRLWALLRLAWTYLRLGNYSKALEFCLQLLSLAEKLDDLEHQALTYNIMASVYGEVGNFEQSIAQFEHALVLFQALGNKERERAVLGNFCHAYRMYGKYDIALDFGLHALQLSIDADDLQQQAVFLCTLGEVYVELGKYETALDHYRQSLSLSVRFAYTRNENRVRFGLGRIYLRQGRADDALEQMQLTLEMAQRAGYKTIIYDAHDELSKIYEAQEQFQQALYHHQQFHQIRETVMSQEQTTKIQHLQISHQMEQAQREAETQRRLREDEQLYYERLSKMKDELIGTASHDLKSPLNSIMLGIDLLREHGNLSDSLGQALLQRLDTSAERMRDLISDLLDLAKLETGRGLMIQQIALQDFLQKAIETFQPFAQKQGVTLQLQSHYPEAFIHGDTSRLQQVIDNLLSNAIKYNQAGGEVEVASEVVNEEVVVKIRDTGIGIPTQALPHLFERFYRVNEQAHRAVEGTGLGLAIVKSIIEQHGGKIWVESQPGRGSTFSFSLPHAAAYVIA